MLNAGSTRAGRPTGVGALLRIGESTRCSGSTRMGWLTWADGSTRVGGSTSEVGSTRVGGSTLQDTAGSGGRGPQGPPQLPWKLGNNNNESLWW